MSGCRGITNTEQLQVSTRSEVGSGGTSGGSLDPDDWTGLRALGHRMLDDVFDDLQGIREQPVWRPMPEAVRATWTQPMPRDGEPPDQTYAAYRELIAPFGVGNRHPGFLGWVHGGGTAVGMLAEMLAGGLNANCGGRDHAPVACERQVIRWAAEMLGLPLDSSGLVLSGTSMANFVGVLVARSALRGEAVRREGVDGARLVGYASARAHLCVASAFDMAGLGSDALRLVPCDTQYAMCLGALRDRIAADRAAGLAPFMVVGTAGSVDVGAIDDLRGIAGVCAEERLWMHVDAAFGAVGMLSPSLRPLFAGMERADSVAFDWHKWAQVPYDAGCIVVRDAKAHQAAFARTAAYLRREEKGLAAGAPWPVDLGPELSRPWAGAVARVPGAQGLDDAARLWREPDRRGRRAQLRSGSLVCRRHRCRALAGARRPCAAEHRLFPVSPGLR